jgi:excinuclease ABC subunit A
MYAFNALVENCHTLLLFELNLEVIKAADWIIDLGPVGGKDGGQLVYEGPVKGILKFKESFTGHYLKDKL